MCPWLPFLACIPSLLICFSPSSPQSPPWVPRPLTGVPFGSLLPLSGHYPALIPMWLLISLCIGGISAAASISASLRPKDETALQRPQRLAKRCLLRAPRRATIKKPNRTKHNKCWRGCGKIGIFVSCGRERKMVRLLGRTVGSFSKS